jgi:hypothetical protein
MTNRSSSRLVLLVLTAALALSAPNAQAAPLSDQEFLCTLASPALPQAPDQPPAKAVAPSSRAGAAPVSTAAPAIGCTWFCTPCEWCDWDCKAYSCGGGAYCFTNTSDCGSFNGMCFCSSYLPDGLTGSS